MPKVNITSITSINKKLLNSGQFKLINRKNYNTNTNLKKEPRSKQVPDLNTIPRVSLNTTLTKKLHSKSNSPVKSTSFKSSEVTHLGGQIN